MRPELEEQIMNEFPWFEARNIWTGERLGFPISCECSDGWYDLIYKMCQEIDLFYKEKNKDIFQFRIEQIKEKYAGLNIYISNYIEGIEEIIEKYEEKSYYICEVCGIEGSVRVRGSWLKTLCNEHMKELGYNDCKQFIE